MRYCRSVFGLLEILLLKGLVTASRRIRGRTYGAVGLALEPQVAQPPAVRLGPRFGDPPHQPAPGPAGRAAPAPHPKPPHPPAVRGGPLFGAPPHQPAPEQELSQPVAGTL